MKARKEPRRGILSLVLLIAFSANAASAETPGQSLFEQKCASCHSEARVLRSLRAIDAAERLSKLERLLPGHYAADSSERKLIIEYLAAKAGK